MEADEEAVSEVEQEGQGGDEFVRFSEALPAWWMVLYPGSLGGAERGVRRGMGARVLALPGDWWLGWSGWQPVSQERDEAQWDAILEAVKLFKRPHGKDRGRSSSSSSGRRRNRRWVSEEERAQRTTRGASRAIVRRPTYRLERPMNEFLWRFYDANELTSHLSFFLSCVMNLFQTTQPRWWVGSSRVVGVASGREV